MSVLPDMYTRSPRAALQLLCNTFMIRVYCIYNVIFGLDVSVMILLRINILSKIITETSYPKLTIKPHKLHYKYNLLASFVKAVKS